MRYVRAWLVRLTGVFGRAGRERDLAAELDAHLDLHVADNLAAGMTPDAARRHALVKLGGIEATKERYRQRRGLPLVDAFVQDLRFGLRTLRRSPAFATSAVLTIALGVGPTTAMFSMVYGVLLRPLPYRDADRLVLIEAYAQFAGRPAVRANYSLVDLEDWRTRARTLESVAFFGMNDFVVDDEPGSERVSAAIVSEELFQTVGGELILGRPLGPADYDSPVVVISQDLWQGRYGGATDIIGQPIVLGSRTHPSRSYTVVGVAAASFQLPRANIWIPAGYAEGQRGRPVRRGLGGFNPVARLRPGVTLAQAQADVDRVSRELAQAYPDTHGNRNAQVVGVRAGQVAPIRAALLMLFAAVGLLLFVACANTANLLLTRSASRAREVAVRAALGASRRRLIGQSLVESGLLAAAGCGVGLLMAAPMVTIFVRLAPPGVPRLDSIRVDTPVLTFAIVVTVLTATLVALAPLLQSVWIAEALRVAARTTSGSPAARRLRRSFVVAEIAVCVVLLVGTALVGRSLVRLLQTDIGISADNVAALLIDLSRGQPPDEAQTTSLVAQIEERVGAIPGIQAVGFGASAPPHLTRSRVSFRMVDSATGELTEYLIDSVPATPGFFEALGIRLVRGRLPTEADTSMSQPVILIDTEMERRFFGDRDPIGTTLPLGLEIVDGRRADVTIVGIVGDVKYLGLDQASGTTIYFPFSQWPIESAFLVARTDGDAAAALPVIRSVIRTVDSRIVVDISQTLDGLVAEQTVQPRVRALVLLVLAGLALALAAVGLYGVVAYWVAQRTTEIGVRMALGATPPAVLSMVMREGVQLVAIGGALGTMAAIALTRALGTLLYGISPTDPVSFAAALLCLTIVTLVASYLPARRATCIDPVAALRDE